MVVFLPALKARMRENLRNVHNRNHEGRCAMESSSYVRVPEMRPSTAFSQGEIEGQRELARRILRAGRNPDDRRAMQQIRRICAQLVRQVA